MDRRAFLRLAAGAAVLASCSSDAKKPAGPAGASGPGGGQRTLRIAQWSAARAGIPGYDEWFDHQYTQRWGEEHGVRVVVEHYPLSELTSRAEAEVVAQAGHDLFGFSAAPPAFEDHVIDHREIVEEIKAKVGNLTPLAERSVRNPKTGKYFGFPESWTPQLTHYRADLWEQVGAAKHPTTWETVQLSAAALRNAGHPVGIGMSQDQESSYALLGLLHAHGATLQDEDANLTLKSPATVEAVKVAAAIFRAGMNDEVFNWDAVANNRLLASGKGSFILNGVSALRAVEAQDPALATRIGLLPIPAGPVDARSPYLMGIYVIWKFSPNVDLARRFLVDLTLDYREAFVRSGFYKMPAFAGAVSDLDQLVAGRYSLLGTADDWSTNLGHPGHANAAVEEILNRHLVPTMFAAAARGELSAEEAVGRAAAQAEPIFAGWRERGKI